MKKIAVRAVVGQIIMVGMLAATGAGAQTVGVGGTGSAGSGIIVSPAQPITPPSSAAGFIQFNNLTVQSVSGTNLPAEIVAVSPVIVPMIYNGANDTTEAPNAAGTVSSAGATVCLHFNAESDNAGIKIACPTPPGATTSSPAANMPMPFRPQPYRIEIDASTKLYLRDRTPAALANITAGDQINVFGYYNTDGSIQAYLVRDISKPVQSETLQLNNVDIISLSASTTPATLVVAQQTFYPCYGFGASGNDKQAIACPMGISSSTTSSALQNTPIPQALMPTWAMARKYQIIIDANTIILDNNRTRLQLSDLQVGDQLNIYGETADNGQTLTADIVRDLSVPAAAQNYTGTVTQVNADGSFIIQTPDGRTLTVQSPIQVGAALQLMGLLNRLTNVLSQVMNITTGPNKAVPGTPGMLRAQGVPMIPANASGTPNTQN